jgi:hypothetical protein
MKITKSLLLYPLQIASYIGFFYTAVFFDVHLNLFDWTPSNITDLETIIFPIIILSLCLLVYWVTPKLARRFVFVVNLLQGLLAVCAAYYLLIIGEPLIQDVFFGRGTPSPLWFKLTLISFLILPVVVSRFRLTKHCT